MVRVRSKDPVLRPLAAVDVPLTVIIPNRLFLGYIIMVVQCAGAFGGWEVGSEGTWSEARERKRG